MLWQRVLWVASQVVTGSTSLEQCYRINKLIQLMAWLLQLNNFNSAHTIIEGLSTPSVRRLRVAWKVNNKKT